MATDGLKKHLRFCYIINESSSHQSLKDQVICALESGATIIIYEENRFLPENFIKIDSIRDLCKTNQVPFIVTDNVLLAKSVRADGIHINTSTDSIESVRQILGYDSIVGISVSSKKNTDEQRINRCNFVITDLPCLKKILKVSEVPVIIRTEMEPETIEAVLKEGASGICVSQIETLLNSTREKTEKTRFLLNIKNCQPASQPWKNEFQLIDKLVRHLKKYPRVKIPPGDDACLLSDFTSPVITTDTHRESIHFKFDWQTPYEIGYKSVIVTLSDLAASYANPICVFINLGLPKHISETSIELLYDGVRQALDENNCALGGGNISKSDQLSIDLFAIGECYSEYYPSRSNGLPGDGLYVSGPIGYSKAGLLSLFKGDETFPELIRAFKSPQAKFKEARILRQNNVACVMDISDGLFGDANHIAKASGITIQIDLSEIKLSDQFTSFCHRYHYSPEKMALEGGEDYELLFTCSPDIFLKIKKMIPNAFKVGTCLKFNGKSIVHAYPDAVSYQHG